MAKSDREKNRITMTHARQEIAKEYRDKISELESDNLKLKKMLAEYQEENRYLRSQVANLSEKAKLVDENPLLSKCGVYMSTYMNQMMSSFSNEEE